MSLERIHKFVVLSQEMKCFTKAVYLLLAFNILGCSYAYSMPKFRKQVTDLYSLFWAFIHSSLLWLQHGLVIMSDQRSLISSNPEDHVVRDVKSWYD